jgi:hypothetical protein
MSVISEQNAEVLMITLRGYPARLQSWKVLTCARMYALISYLVCHLENSSLSWYVGVFSKNAHKVISEGIIMKINQRTNEQQVYCT